VLPEPRILADAPIEFVSARTLFDAGSPRRRSAASVVRLESSGRLLLAFSDAPAGDLRNAGALALSTSDDGGGRWSEPEPLYAYPGWFCLAMGGLARVSDELVHLVLGRVRFDLALGGTEPMTDWFVAIATSRDGGRTWSNPGPEIRLFPYWTEMYGASNPHVVKDGRLMWAVMGTMGRDEGWHAGATFSDPEARVFTPPVVIAREPSLDYSDIDVVRLASGRFLAVVREHRTRQSVLAHSDDEGKTWTRPRPTPFKGSNLKLFRLRSGAVLCAYRDEDPGQRGVSLSATRDGGKTWRFCGQLYAAGPEAAYRPGHVCGYPDLVSLGGDEIGCVLHGYPTERGAIELHWLRLRDRTAADPAAGAPAG